MQLVRRAVAESMYVHPRLSHQQLDGQEQRQKLADSLPEFVPFRGQKVQGVVAVLDWDHRLPSRTLTLRLHLLYTRANQEQILRAMEIRAQHIAARDLYPEFDVPDYGGLPGDEIYECELRPDLTIVDCRLTSSWRRDIAPEDAAPAVAAVRRSQAFAKTKQAHRGRASNLGDLEAVAWTPPCESGHNRWTLDVWWLTAFDGRVGKGWSFLVDPEQKPGDRVVAHREFSVRAG